MAKTTQAIGNYLNLLFCNIGWGAVGDVTGLLPSTTAGSFYVSLHTADPGASGNQTTSEAAYAGYARVGIARSNTQWTVSAPQVTNTNAAFFPGCTTGSETEAYWGIGTASTGAGHLLYSGPLTGAIVSFTAETTDDITIPNITINIDDRIAFFNGTPDDTFPTGLTQGTLYFVKTVTGDVITVSTTSGGAVVNITGAGAGVCAIVTPFAVSSGVIPSLPASALVILEN